MKISFVGGGTIARGLIGGLIHAKFSAKNIYVSNRGVEKLQALQKEFGIQTAMSNTSAVEKADVVVLCLKAQVVQSVCREIATTVQTKKPLIVSLAPGVRVQDIDRWLGSHSSIVRSMPSTSLKSTVLYAKDSTTIEQKAATEKIFNANGKSFWVKTEAEVDKLTPLIGCGTAYICMMMEAMAKSAEKRGISPEASNAIVKEVANGTLSLLENPTRTPQDLRKIVTTPNGVTEHSLRELLKDGFFFKIFDQAYTQAEKRCEELANDLGKDKDVITPRSKL